MIQKSIFKRNKFYIYTFILLKLTLLQGGGADHPSAELSRDCHCGGEHPGHPQRTHPQPPQDPLQLLRRLPGRGGPHCEWFIFLTSSWSNEPLSCLKDNIIYPWLKWVFWKTGSALRKLQTVSALPELQKLSRYFWLQKEPKKSSNVTLSVCPCYALMFKALLK